ncbi:hypothetical protein V1478_017332 [Vespula squamosa]|uniref:Uncharacterized protein n=1 Tax=Vespula squamosa TaxID=30214 RepID=A0ABD1ZXN9_VESSQ
MDDEKMIRDDTRTSKGNFVYSSQRAKGEEDGRGAMRGGDELSRVRKLEIFLKCRDGKRKVEEEKRKGKRTNNGERKRKARKKKRLTKGFSSGVGLTTERD